MRKQITICAMAVLALLTACGGGGPKGAASGAEAQAETKAAETAKLFPVEHGTIRQQMEAMGMKTTPTVYFDKWGEWQATESYSDMTMMGQKVVLDNSIEITKGSDHWKIDLEKMTGVKTTQSFKNAMGFDPDQFTDEMKKELAANDMKVDQQADTTIMGHTCKKFHVTSQRLGMDVHYAAWGNIIMKMWGTTMQMPMKLEVLSIDASAPPASKFEVPEGVTITGQ